MFYFNPLQSKLIKIIKQKTCIFQRYRLWTKEKPTSKDQKAPSLCTFGCHKPLIPVVTFLTPLVSNS